MFLALVRFGGFSGIIRFESFVRRKKRKFGLRGCISGTVYEFEFKIQGIWIWAILLWVQSPPFRLGVYWPLPPPSVRRTHSPESLTSTPESNPAGRGGASKSSSNLALLARDLVDKSDTSQIRISRTV